MKWYEILPSSLVSISQANNILFLWAAGMLGQVTVGCNAYLVLACGPPYETLWWCTSCSLICFFCQWFMMCFCLQRFITYIPAAHTYHAIHTITVPNIACYTYHAMHTMPCIPCHRYKYHATHTMPFILFQSCLQIAIPWSFIWNYHCLGWTWAVSKTNKDTSSWFWGSLVFFCPFPLSINIHCLMRSLIHPSCSNVRSNGCSYEWFDTGMHPPTLCEGEGHLTKVFCIAEHRKISFSLVQPYFFFFSSMPKFNCKLFILWRSTGQQGTSQKSYRSYRFATDGVKCWLILSPVISI